MPTPPRPTRRRFLKRTATAALTLGLPTGAYAWRIEPHWVHVVRRDLPIAHLPADLAGRTLAQISDLHAGPVVDPGYLAHALRMVNRLNPDLVAVTGDFMTSVGGEEIGTALRAMEHLKPGRLGTVAVLGNHDYGMDWQKDLATGDRLARGLRDLGFIVLRNGSTEVAGLTISGVDDLWGPAFAPKKVLPKLDPARANLVLVHNPDVADLPVWGGYKGWILCGHTHGGQCSAPLFGPPILPVKNKRYTSGAFDLSGGRHLYINPGLGYLRRVRFNVPPEITLFTLRAGAEVEA
jgi:predicted MPP superfamily phosphohydrolase